MEKLKPIVEKIKKGEIAIYVVALMLVGAGYFNYITFNSSTEETYSEDVEELEEYANIGDAVLVSSNEFENINIEETNIIYESNDNENTTNKNLENLEESTEKIEEDSEKKEEESSENKEEQTENQIEDEVNDYFINSKLERDQMYAEMISNYEAILNNTNVSEAQKTIATQEITKINNTKNAIMICENLILTKDFNQCVILINEENVNIVVSIEGGLTEEKVAQIQNIISREIGTEIENIHITEI